MDQRLLPVSQESGKPPECCLVRACRLLFSFYAVERKLGFVEGDCLFSHYCIWTIILWWFGLFSRCLKQMQGKKSEVSTQIPTWSFPQRFFFAQPLNGPLNAPMGGFGLPRGWAHDAMVWGMFEATDSRNYTTIFIHFLVMTMLYWLHSVVHILSYFTVLLSISYFLAPMFLSFFVNFVGQKVDEKYSWRETGEVFLVCSEGAGKFYTLLCLILENPKKNWDDLYIQHPLAKAASLYWISFNCKTITSTNDDHVYNWTRTQFNTRVDDISLKSMAQGL